jgi:hypothetical protein
MIRAHVVIRHDKIIAFLDFTASAPKVILPNSDCPANLVLDLFYCTVQFPTILDITDSQQIDRKEDAD